MMSANLLQMQAELTQPYDAILDHSRFDVEPVPSEEPTNLTCYNCGSVGHVSRNCLWGYPYEKLLEAAKTGGAR